VADGVNGHLPVPPMVPPDLFGELFQGVGEDAVGGAVQVRPAKRRAAAAGAAVGEELDGAEAQVLVAKARGEARLQRRRSGGPAAKGCVGQKTQGKANRKPTALPGRLIGEQVVGAA